METCESLSSSFFIFFDFPTSFEREKMNLKRPRPFFLSLPFLVLSLTSVGAVGAIYYVHDEQVQTKKEMRKQINREIEEEKLNKTNGKKVD